VPIGERKILHHADENLGALSDAGAFDRRSGTLDVHLDRVDADAYHVITPNQLDQVSRVATTGVEKP
jgi:hypothetical protein